MNILTSSVPVFMYHKIGVPVRCRRDRFLNIDPESFGRQMRAIARLGYRTRSFAEVVESLSSGKRLPARSFAITFDDGYSGIEEFAFPILKELAFTATIFVVSDAAGKSNSWDQNEGHAVLPLLDWDWLKRLAEEGWELGGHTRTHPHLDALPDEEAYRDILSGREELEAAIGQSATTFCYPYGHFNTRTPGLVQKAGFHGACTVRSGLATLKTDRYTIPRVKIAYGDGVAGMLYRMLVSPRLPVFRRNRRSHQIA